MTRQQEAIDRIIAGENLFVTGAGGTGKSWIIHQIVDDSVVLTAPTGIAALNIGGSTCHSQFSLPVGLPSMNDAMKINKKFRKVFGQGSEVTTVIIDEIGTLRADYLDLIDQKLKHARDSHEPFGGLQVVAVGDLFQLSPIVSQNERSIYYGRYSSAYPFAARSWDFNPIELDVIHRQTNPMHVQVLESIRRGNEEVHDAIDIIRHLASQVHLEGSLRLCCYNKDAESVNEQEYKKVPGRENFFNAQIIGDWGNDQPVPKNLRLKIGTKVLICANGEGYVNGDRGVVVSMKHSSVMVQKENGQRVKIEPWTWEKYDYSNGHEGFFREVSATYTQLPLRHGWAVSIHKSQGMTLDGVTIDVGRGCFAHGQLYVALSRCRDLENINFVTPPDVSDVIVDRDVKAFYANLGY